MKHVLDKVEIVTAVCEKLGITGTVDVHWSLSIVREPDEPFEGEFGKEYSITLTIEETCNPTPRSSSASASS